MALLVSQHKTDELLFNFHQNICTEYNFGLRLEPKLVCQKQLRIFVIIGVFFFIPCQVLTHKNTTVINRKIARPFPSNRLDGKGQKRTSDVPFGPRCFIDKWNKLLTKITVHDNE